MKASAMFRASEYLDAEATMRGMCGEPQKAKELRELARQLREESAVRAALEEERKNAEG